MARPKGVIQKRDESKYWLPENVILIDDKLNYNKDTKLKFKDLIYGEFTSSYKALQNANASTHPDSVMNRRENTNIDRYGVKNAGATKESRSKAQKTMIDKYGVKNALESDIFLNKSKETLKSNYGVSHPMQSEALKSKMLKSVMDKYGTKNVMQNEEVKAKLVKTNMSKYGVKNASMTSDVKAKIIQSSKTYVSKGELQLKQYIEGLGFICKKGYLGGNNPKEIDIMIEDSNICFEFNGAIWHSEFNKNMYPMYHRDKTNIALSKGKELIQVFDFEWKERNYQVKSFIKSKLGKNKINVFARKTEFKLVDKLVAKTFLNNNHILGSCNFKYAYGLFFNDELQCLATFGDHHRLSKSNVLVLSRYVGKYDTTVVGGLSKLCKNVFKLHGEFITWIDRRWSTGQSWFNNGWTNEQMLRPDYFYLDIKNHKIINKQLRKKSVVNTPKGITENEHSRSESLYRIWDSGKIRLKFNIIL